METISGPVMTSSRRTTASNWLGSSRSSN
jgi:hypothetical protein